MKNSMEELQFLSKLCLQGWPRKAPTILEVLWLLLAPNWLKLDTNGAARGCLSIAACGSVFRTFCLLVKGAYSFPLGIRKSYYVDLSW